MPKQAFKVCFYLFMVLSLLANCCLSANPFDQSFAPAESESENKFMSPESLPVIPIPDSSMSEAEAVADQTPDVGTKSDETLADEPTDLLQISNGEDSLYQENASLRRSNADPPPAVETNKDSTEDVLAVGTKEDDDVSRESLSSEVTNGLASAPANVETPAPKPSDDGIFIQDNQSPPVVTYVNAAAPETKGDQDITIEESQDSENIVNGYDSPPKSTAVPAPSEALSFSESEPPTIDEQGSWDVVNGVVAGVLVVGACAIGVGVSVYQKRKKDDMIKAQYQCLDKKISL